MEAGNDREGQLSHSLFCFCYIANRDTKAKIQKKTRIVGVVVVVVLYKYERTMINNFHYRRQLNSQQQQQMPKLSFTVK